MKVQTITVTDFEEAALLTADMPASTGPDFDWQNPGRGAKSGGT